MQVTNVNTPITVTGRHVSVTDAMRDYAEKKVAGLHLDYPKIIEAKVLLNVEQDRHIAEIILFCANHIVIEADSTTQDMYASIDETISKIARRMRKYKTRMLKSHRPKKHKDDEPMASPEMPAGLPDEILEGDAAAAEAGPEEEEPYYVHREQYRVKTLLSDEAIAEMELNGKPFVLFNEGKSGRLSLIYRREDGDYGMISPSIDE